MSIQSCQINVARLRSELASLEKQASDETKKELEKTKQIYQLQQNITNSTSLSTLRSMQQQIVRLSEDVVRIQSKKADISKGIAYKTSQLYKYQQDLRKEEESERQKIEQVERRRALEQLNYQRALNRELAEQTNITPVLAPQSPFSDVAARKSVAYDVFISHAWEDKKEFAEPLAQALQLLEFNVWYDDFQLKVGDSLRRSIDRGLAKSRYGVVVLSSAFFTKNWPQYELDGLVAREMSGAKVILPIWHKVSKDEVLFYSPSLADKVALNSSLFSTEEIAERLAEVLRE